MSYKKNFLYFFYQTIVKSSNPAHAKEMRAFFSDWKAALTKDRNSVKDEMAWLNFKAVQWLSQHLKNDQKLFEYGGGGSTLFFLKRTGFVATVENDGEWFRILSEKIKEKGYSHWQGFFQEGQPISDSSPRKPENPEDYLSNTGGQAHLSYEAYAKTICQFPEAYFDYVLVDGRARPSCMVVAFSRLKKGGYLIIDNMERDYYQTAFQQHLAHHFEVVLNGYYPTPYHPDFTITGIYQKR